MKYNNNMTHFTILDIKYYKIKNYNYSELSQDIMVNI